MKTRIRELAKKKGLLTAYQFQKATSLSPSMAARLFKDDVELIALKTLDVLCRVLECKPGDIFIEEDRMSK